MCKYCHFTQVLPITDCINIVCLLGRIPAPAGVLLKRFDDNTTIQVTWLPIDSPQIISYDIEYSIYTLRTSSEPPTTTIISSPGPNNLAIDIIGVDGDTNYQARVRGVAEVDRENDKLINTDEGSWSSWVVSQVKPIPPPQGKCFHRMLCSP